LHLDLPTVTHRRLRGDMIEVYKILITNTYNTVALPDLQMHAGSVTRGALML